MALTVDIVWILTETATGVYTIWVILQVFSRATVNSLWLT